jgi:anti-sigma factor RsiW
MSSHRKLKSWMFKLPTMLNCAEAEELLHDHHEGDLPANRRWRLNFHLKLCRECTSYLAAYENSIALGQSALRDAEPADDLPDDIVAKITAAHEQK